MLFPYIRGSLVSVYGQMERTVVFLKSANWDTPQKMRIKKPASAQSNLRLCHSLFGKYYIHTYNVQNVDILSSLGSSVGRAGTYLVGNPDDRFSRVDRSMSFNLLITIWRGG